MQESADQLRQRNRMLEDRISSLCAAVLRVSASLDLETVLREIVDSARALTGARYGAITTIDDAGQAQNFITAGFTPGVHRYLTDQPDGPRLFLHFRDLPAPLRVPDLSAHVESLGFPSDWIPVKSFQATPMRHQGVLVGHFFLAEKESGSEFTAEDEEVLVLFASQAATAIANARTHRDERRARADLEALVETSPVGVVVFDGGSGRLVSFNRAARRIVEPLRMPEKALEELLDVVTCHRGDGREVPLAQFPMAQQLSSAETVRAEEITLSVPDGRRVTTLVNATPIRSADGAVESMVVTLQDLAPLEELERQRAEFLSMVSHELRTPLISIKGSTATVLGASPAPAPAEMLQFFRVIDGQADRMRGLIADLLDQGRIETGTLSVSLEPAEVAGLVDQARSTFLGSGGGHALSIDLPEDLPRVMADPGRIVQVLNNLFSNASRHSPEVVSDPGRGRAGRPARGGLGIRPGPGRAAGPAAAPVPQACPHSSWRGGGPARRLRPGAVDMQGTGGGARRPHLGRERGGGARHPLHVHPAGGRGRRRCGRPRAAPLPPAPRGGRADAHPRGRRRPAHPALRAGHPGRGGLRPGRDRRPGGAAGPHQDAQAAARPAGPGAAGHRRHQADGRPARARGPAGHLHLGLRPGRDDRQGAGRGSCRLHRQALFIVGADGAGAGGPAAACRPGALPAGGVGDPLRGPPRHRGRPRG